MNAGAASHRDYAVVTGAYWTYTLTDGAIRTLVLFHLERLGYVPLEIVGLFLAYELLGVVTNLVAGRVATRFGLRSTLLAGLALQTATCAAFALAAHPVTLVVLALGQGACGVSKDLVKTSAKTWVKLVVREGDRSGLMRLVSLLTGSKNALKGVGFLLGGALLTGVGFAAACAGMAAALALALVLSATLLPSRAGRAASPHLVRFFSRDTRLNWLSAARLFLFASRDAWFVLALPFFLRAEEGWSVVAVSTFLALWTIGYGVVQAAAPRFVGRDPDARRLLVWGATLALPLAAVVAALELAASPGPWLVVALAVFGALFAANSAIHSFLVVHFAERERAASDVGFYYASNAAGRCLGTFLSGALHQAFGGGSSGLVACIGAAGGLTVLALACSVPLVAAERRATPA
ncbi:MAG: organoarsenical effux MFS transporter ArsJ [Planctomycetota bacterium]